MNHLDRIRLENASIAIGQELIIQNLNWQVKKGEHWAITGNCGTGKSVLSQFLNYKHRLAKGRRSYPFLGPNPSMESFRKAVRFISFMDTGKLFDSAHTIHYYQQRFNAFDSEGHLTVRQYIEHEEINLDGEEALLKKIGIWDLLDLERIKLSSGQTRKMLLCKILLSQPDLLILDNAYLGLDKKSRLVLNELLDTLVKESNISLILSGHHKELPNCISHRLHLDRDGQYQTAPINEFKELTEPRATKASTLSDIKEIFKEKNFEDNLAEIIRLDQVAINYDEKTILKPLDWKVQCGEKWVIYGPNGAGKSTLLSLIYADNPQAYSKEIYLFGRKRGSGESIWDIKRKIGYTSPELHAYFRENHKAEKIVLTGLTDTFYLRKRASEEEIKLNKLLFEYFDIEKESNKPFKQCATGIQRLLLFMRALIKIPPVLLLDEPFQGLDEDFIEKAKLLLEEILCPQQSLIFISHYKKEWPNNIQFTLDLTAFS